MTGASRAVPIAEAARIAGVSPRTLRRWIRAGAPVARRGGRGRGRVTLVCPAAVAAWRRAQRGQTDPGDLLRVLAADLPELLACAVVEAFRAAEGPSKVATAWPLADAWYRCTQALLERLRADCLDVPDLAAVPEPISYLVKIGR